MVEIKKDIHSLSIKQEALAAEVSEVKKTVASVQTDTAKILELVQGMAAAATSSAPSATAATPTAEPTFISLTRQELLEEISNAVQVQIMKEVGETQSKLITMENTVRSLFSELQQEQILLSRKLKDSDDDKKGEKKNKEKKKEKMEEKKEEQRGTTGTLKGIKISDPAETISRPSKPAAKSATAISSAKPTSAPTKSKAVHAEEEIDPLLLEAAKEMLQDCGFKHLKKMSAAKIMEAAALIQQKEIEDAAKLTEEALAEAKREKEAADLARKQPVKTSKVQIVSKFEDMPHDAEKKQKVKATARKPSKKMPPIKSIDDLLKSRVMGIDTVQHVSFASTPASGSGLRNIIDWELDSSRDVIILTRANQQRTEIADPYVIPKFPISDIEDLGKIKLKNPDHIPKGIIAESLVQMVLKKLDVKKRKQGQ